MDSVPRGARVVVYRRNSTTDQINSLQDQTKVIQRTVDEYGLEVVEIVTDAGISGSTLDDRAGLKTFLERARTSKAVYVLIQDTSRISRNGQCGFWEIINILKQAGIMVYSCQNRLFVTEAHGAIFGIEAAFARNSNHRHSFDIVRTLIEGVQTRKSDPGRVPPDGYDRMRYNERNEPVELVRYYPDGTKALLDPATLAVRMKLEKSIPLPKIKSQLVKLVLGAPERVATVRRIFRRIKSTGFAGVADELNLDGIPGPRGGRWSSGTIRDLVLNPAYIGVVTYGRTFKAKYHRVRGDRMEEFDFLHEGKLNRGDVPEAEWFQEADRHEPLISREEWDEVQAALKRRSHQQTKTTRSPNHVYILTGIAKCARCGEALHGHTQRGKKGETYIKYTCSTARKFGASQCARYSVDGPELEGRVIGEVQSYFTMDCCKTALREGLELMLGERERGRGRTEAKRKELSALEAKKTALFNQFTPENLATFRSQIDRITEDEGRLRRELIELEREEGAQEDKAAFIERAMRFFEENVLALEGGCEKALRESLLALGTEVTWDPDNKEGGLRIYPFGHSAAN